jgi:hypothetical protein
MMKTMKIMPLWRYQGPENQRVAYTLVWFS